MKETSISRKITIDETKTNITFTDLEVMRSSTDNPSSLYELTLTPTSYDVIFTFTSKEKEGVITFKIPLSAFHFE